MHNLSGIVFCDACVEIVSQACVVAFGILFASEEIDIGEFGHLYNWLAPDFALRATPWQARLLDKVPRRCALFYHLACPGEVLSGYSNVVTIKVGLRLAATPGQSSFFASLRTKTGGEGNLSTPS